jgi:hypothetical protein
MGVSGQRHAPAEHYFNLNTQQIKIHCGIDIGSPFRKQRKREIVGKLASYPLDTGDFLFRGEAVGA